MLRKTLMSMLQILSIDESSVGTALAIWHGTHSNGNVLLRDLSVHLKDFHQDWLSKTEEDLNVRR